MIEFLKACFNGPIPFRLLSGAIIILIIIWVIWGNQITNYKEDRENRRNEKHEINADKTLENTELIKQILLDKMETIDTARNSELMLKYPLGYFLFAVDHKKIVFPYNSGIESLYEFNWDNARVLDLNSKEIVIKLPSINELTQGTRINNPTLILPRQVGYTLNIFRFRDSEIISEVITDDEFGIIVLLGFKKV